MDQSITAPIFKHRRTTLERIEKYISPTVFTDVNLYGKLYKDRKNVTDITHWKVPGLRGDWLSWKFDEIIEEKFEPVKTGFQFGPSWSTHWFKISFVIPKEWSGEEVRLRWKTATEAMVWSSDGKPLQGLSSGVDYQLRTDFILSDTGVEYSEPHVFYIEVAGSTMFGLGKGGMINPPDPDRTFTLSLCEIVLFNTEVHSLVVDLEVMAMLARELEDDQRGNNAMFAGNQMINLIVENNLEEAKKISQTFFRDNPTSKKDHELALMGMCHIDSAWLWPYSETIRKGARSWSAAAKLMERFPDFIFACSQAQQLEWVKLEYPSLFERLLQLSKENRFIHVGATWVEMDGLLPSGESFMRQFLYGQKFYTDSFGSACKEFWLPDTFGYNAQIPQICNHFGIKRFLTQKLSWSLVNKFPHNTFIWEGLDGSKVLSHFPPGDSYEMKCEVKEGIKTLKNLKDKGRVNVSAFLFGYGDGGGGPTEEMLMRAERLKDVDGCPRMVHTTPDEFFTKLEASERNYCKWVGELYLELHNGTYTSQAHTKRMNRVCEFALRDAEILMSMVSSKNLVALKMLQGQRKKCEIEWKKVLLNQFHDVIPGSSIAMVYEDSDKLYEEVVAQSCSIIKECFEALSSKTEKRSDVLVFNSMPWNIQKVLKLNTTQLDIERSVIHSNFVAKLISDPYYSQIADNDTYVPVEIASMSFSQPKILTPETVKVSSKDGITVMENKYLIVHFSASGQIIKLLAKGDKNRDLFGASPNDRNSTGDNKDAHSGNIIALYDDIPLYWDAWDVMDYHLETRKILNCTESKTIDMPVKVIEAEPHFAQIEWHNRISEKSYLKQKVSLSSLDPYLTFDCNVDWYESHKFLKVEFDTNLLCRNAKYDIQFGHVERPTYRNTSWDAAKFEVCGHKWASLQEAQAGIAILNDCKYGWSAYGSKISLSLLRAPKAPDDTCDMGSHVFRYGVMPYQSDFSNSGVVKAAYEFNRAPLVEYNKENSMFSDSFIILEGDGIMIEASKLSEDNVSDVILRLVELHGNQVEAKLKIPKELKLSHSVLCNGMEEDLKELSLTEENLLTVFVVPFLPFQIHSLKLKFQK